MKMCGQYSRPILFSRVQHWVKCSATLPHKEGIRPKLGPIVVPPCHGCRNCPGEWAHDPTLPGHWKLEGWERESGQQGGNGEGRRA